jgi:hypothetical protein
MRLRSVVIVPTTNNQYPGGQWPSKMKQGILKRQICDARVTCDPAQGRPEGLRQGPCVATPR